MPRQSGPTLWPSGNSTELHLGHRALLARCRPGRVPARSAWWGRHLRTPPFQSSPAGVSPPVLTGLAQKLRLFREAGVQFVVAVRGGSHGSRGPGRGLCPHVLRDRMATRIVVVGKNFQFGRGGRGGISTIRKLVAATGLDGVEVGNRRGRGSAGFREPDPCPPRGRRYQSGQRASRPAVRGSRQGGRGRPGVGLGVGPALARGSCTGQLPSATIRPGHQRSGPLLHGQVEVHRHGAGPHRLTVRWTDRRCVDRQGQDLSW